MTPFFDGPIVNSPYEYPHQHWELDESGQPTGNLSDRRRRADFITPIPKPKKRRGSRQQELVLDEGKGLTTKGQAYDLTSVINEVRSRFPGRMKPARISMKLRIQNLGPIRNADLKFGDLTVLVGPQASGKSITLQLLKLLVDTGGVQAKLRRYGLDWDGRIDVLLDTYFGEGMHAIWRRDATSVTWLGKTVDLEGIARRKRRDEKETMFLIPAQRVLAMRNGWPLPFESYSPGDPFTVRDFSEQLRRLLEGEFTSEVLFPQDRRLKGEFRDLLKRDVFGDFELRIDKMRSQKRLVLAQAGGGDGLPTMVWSAGQREFIPLLLGLYWLMPPTKTARRGDLKWVVIEEPEMGLHPRAIGGVLLMVLELLRRGYRVCLSTHSTQVLELAWALRNLQDAGASPDAVLGVFGLRPNQALRSLGEAALKTSVAVHYYDRASGVSHDISRLDPSASQPFEADWGGLTDFAERANREVANAVTAKVR